MCIRETEGPRRKVREEVHKSLSSKWVDNLVYKLLSCLMKYVHFLTFTHFGNRFKSLDRMVWHCVNELDRIQDTFGTE